MTQEKTYRQCRLRHDTTETTGWIESRGATVGASVQLFPTGVFWDVVEVFDPVMPESVLREQQRQRRAGLPSIETVAR